MNLIIITDPVFFFEEAEMLARMFDAGMPRLHLRKPDATRREMEDFIKSLPAKYLDKVVIHSHYSLALQYPLGGIHCTSAGREEFYSMNDLHIRRSVSVHGFCEAGSVGEEFSYAFLAPVFDSISKPGHKQAFEHEALRLFLTRPWKTDFVALGGVSLDNVNLCKDMGFKTVALLGSIWNRMNPEQELAEWMEYSSGK